MLAQAELTMAGGPPKPLNACAAPFVPAPAIGDGDGIVGDRLAESLAELIRGAGRSLG